MVKKLGTIGYYLKPAEMMLSGYGRQGSMCNEMRLRYMKLLFVDSITFDAKVQVVLDCDEHVIGKCRDYFGVMPEVVMQEARSGG
jgi:hypothetical protein